MDSMRYDRKGRPLPKAIKIIVAGGFGAGKTTMVGAVSETKPLRTEEILTDKSAGVDDVSGIPPQMQPTPGLPERRGAQRRRQRVLELLHTLPSNAQHAIRDAIASEENQEAEESAVAHTAPRPGPR